MIDAARFPSDIGHREALPVEIEQRYGFQTALLLTSEYSTWTMVELPPAVYELHVLGKHDQPGPVILQVWANRRPVGTLWFARDDESWAVQCLRLFPELWDNPDRITIELRFANDGGEQGSRDAYIAGLWIAPLENHE
ncbi:MAG TPA: hypothetical protein VNK95_01410 [Caldilineaceae bacterium]|nr:hypothetical protein [Caldilineaceae bacterium]